MSISKNENGEIYGSEYLLNQIGIAPDLIQAEGENGIIGYVRASDLDYNPVTCPEEAIAAAATNAELRNIPLYDMDGETVIGTFCVGNGKVICE